MKGRRADIVDIMDREIYNVATKVSSNNSAILNVRMIQQYMTHTEPPHTKPPK